MHATKRLLLLAGLILGLAALGTPLAGADTTGRIMFEPSTYTMGDINAQNGWLKTGAYDVAVANVAAFPAAAGYNFALAPAQDAKCPDGGGGGALVVEQVAKQADGRGLSVGAGHPNHRQLRGGLAIGRARRDSSGSAPIVHDKGGQAGA